MTITMARVNGVGAVSGKNGQMTIPRSVLVRNVMDMLEGNPRYGELDFCDAQAVTDMATMSELVAIYTETLPEEMIEEILRR